MCSRTNLLAAQASARFQAAAESLTLARHCRWSSVVEAEGSTLGRSCCRGSNVVTSMLRHDPDTRQAGWLPDATLLHQTVQQAGADAAVLARGAVECLHLVQSAECTVTAAHLPQVCYC